MWQTSVKYTLLKVLILTHFVLCEEFDVSVLMEKMESIADKIENRTKSKYQDIERVMEKLDGLIKKTMNLFPLAHEENDPKPGQCTDKCRDKLESVRQSLLTDFVLELIEAVNEEKDNTLQLRRELKEFKDDIQNGIPGVHFVEYTNKLTNLDNKLKKLDLKYDAYLRKLRGSEEYLHTGLMEAVAPEEKVKTKTVDACVNVTKEETVLEEPELPYNNTVRLLKADIIAARQEIEFTVKEIHDKQFYLRNHFPMIESNRLSINNLS